MDTETIIDTYNDLTEFSDLTESTIDTEVTTIQETTSVSVTALQDSFEYITISHLKCIVTILAVFLIILVIKLVHDLFNNLMSC